MGCGSSASPSGGCHQELSDAMLFEFLSQVPSFSRFSEDDFRRVAEACISQHYQSGDVVVEMGDMGSEFILLTSGNACITKESRSAPIRTGDFFGEKALQYDDMRKATVTATTALSVLVLSRKAFKDLGLHLQVKVEDRKTMTPSLLKTKKGFVQEKTSEELDLIAEGLRRNTNLQNLMKLDDKKINAMVGACWKETVPAGAKLITAGEVGDYFYVVQSGEFEVTFPPKEVEEKPFCRNTSSGEVLINVAMESAAAPAENNRKTISAGASFGEIALIMLTPRTATVTALHDAIVWVLDRDSFKNILESEQIAENVQLLQKVEILSSLDEEEREKVAQALTKAYYKKTENIINQGDFGDSFYILVEGEVAILADGVEVRRLTASRENSTTAVFGERSLLNREQRTATVQVTSDKAKALQLDRQSFNHLLGPLEDIIKLSQFAAGQADALTTPGKANRRRGSCLIANVTVPAEEREPIDMDHLDKQGLLGYGDTSTVELCQHRETKKLYALKSVSKGYIVKESLQNQVMNERTVLLMCRSKFIVRLYETFNTDQELHFLLEPTLGHSLNQAYIAKGFYGSVDHAQYYIAGVTCAFEHLHDRKVIFRDLKPENIMLTAEGHVKLAAFRLSKFVIGRTYTTCGTPEYFAPELIQCTGYNHAVDWWSLGVLLFELMSGAPPFESPDPVRLFSRIMAGIDKVQFPRGVRGYATDLIKGLACFKPQERLPCHNGGVSNIMDHPWYTGGVRQWLREDEDHEGDGFDWERFTRLQMVPPYIPKGKNQDGGLAFASKAALLKIEKEDLPPRLHYKDDGTGWEKGFTTSKTFGSEAAPDSPKLAPTPE